jgi:hypothetical protein
MCTTQPWLLVTLNKPNTLLQRPAGLVLLLANAHANAEATDVHTRVDAPQIKSVQTHVAQTATHDDLDHAAPAGPVGR